jgi:small neutral amino acid transporter SnatA (MarC family)
MNIATIAFIVLVVMLFSGIGILMKPTSLVPLSVSSTTEESQQPADNSLALKTVITIGSAFLLVGLVGLAVLGFMITRKDEPQKTQNRA